MARYSLVLLDNDGTLMESMYYWRLGGLEYLIAHRLPIPGEFFRSKRFRRKY